MGCASKYDENSIADRLFEISFDSECNYSITCNCSHNICDWFCDAEPENSPDFQTRYPKPQPRDFSSNRDSFTRLNGSAPAKNFVFQHLQSEAYILSYREQFTSASSGTQLSSLSQGPTLSATTLSVNNFSPPSAYSGNSIRNNGGSAPPAPPSTKAFEETGPIGELNTTYLNGVWSVAQKYNLPPPSLNQCSYWWRSGDESSEKGKFGVPSGDDENSKAFPQALPISKRGIQKKNAPVPLSITDQVDQYTKSTTGNRKGQPELVLGGLTGLDVVSDMATHGNQMGILVTGAVGAETNSGINYRLPAFRHSAHTRNQPTVAAVAAGVAACESSSVWPTPRLAGDIDEVTAAAKERLSAAARAELRDATCPNFMFELHDRLVKLEKLQQPQPPLQQRPPSSNRAIGSAMGSNRKTGSSTLVVTGVQRTASAQGHLPPHPKNPTERVGSAGDRPSLPAMPYFRCGSMPLEGRL